MEMHKDVSVMKLGICMVWKVDIMLDNLTPYWLCLNNTTLPIWYVALVMFQSWVSY